MKTRKKKRDRSHATKKSFLFHPENPSKSFNVYINKNPANTIPIKYKTIMDVKDTIRKLEKLYKSKKYSHKRIWQVGMILYVRLRVIKDKKPEEYKLSHRYFTFLQHRTTLSEHEINKLKFIIDK